VNVLLELKTIQNDSLDPCYHLAVEECLLHHLKPGTCLLYLWQSENAVVIGRNQNPWRECRPALLERENTKMVRRPSGGGTVYHDKGNLNFSFIMDRDFYDRDRQLKVILSAVRSFGIDASVNSRYDLIAQGKKFSGSAHRFKKKTALHHGTLLLAVDKENLSRYLKPSPHAIHGNSTSSIRSEVINLTEMTLPISVNDLKQSILIAFQEEYQSKASPLDLNSDIDREVLPNFIKDFTTWDWHYGRTPSFRMVCEILVKNRPQQLTFFVKEGRVEDLRSEPFSQMDRTAQHLADTLLGVRFRQPDLQERLKNNDSKLLDRKLVNFLIQWIDENHI